MYGSTCTDQQNRLNLFRMLGIFHPKHNSLTSTIPPHLEFVKAGMDNCFLELGFGRGKVAAAISKSNATRL
ncbi:hypothetical protein F9C07_4555 [Aspergillus flavus]|uniref:Uncharacterized protein n=1 Tax=Aspergillus flavus (strain ATCC 200026 / FGSC A1120 / IAM 13836 / NRRL 3357 / JCM 12722 / SRRC 167) TaxID=332952 RepID=A0A7U2MLL5_ASPFN|nr:hypothetical protein F9C07_4555 [Aspergillus flavus]